MKKENTAKVLMATAMFIFGTLAPFVRNINVSSGELALYRAVLSALLVGGFLLLTKQKWVTLAHLPLQKLCPVTLPSTLAQNLFAPL